MADTGKTPAVRRGRSDGLLMAFVRALIVVCLILVVVGTAWLVINRVHPQWLADLRLPYTAQSVGPAAPTGADHSKTDTSHSTRPATPTKPALKLVSADGTSATFSVTTALFSVRVTASGGDTWVQATGPLSTTPAFEGDRARRPDPGGLGQPPAGRADRLDRRPHRGAGSTTGSSGPTCRRVRPSR